MSRIVSSNVLPASPLSAPTTTGALGRGGGRNLYDANRQWATRPADQRFETIEALHEAVLRRRTLSRARTVDVGKMSGKIVGDDLRLNGENAACTFTHWSFGQLCTRLGAPAAYLRKLPVEKVGGLLNYHTSQATSEDQALVLFHGDQPSNYVAQAVTSVGYGRIWDADVVAACRKLIDLSDGKFHNPKAYAPDGSVKPQGLYASDRDCFVFLIDGGSVFDASPRAQLSRGVFVWNSEVGAATAGFTTFLFNYVCGNHIVWGAQDVQTRKIRHSKGGPDRFVQAAPELLDYASASAQPMIDTVKRANAYILPDEDADNHGFWNRVRRDFTNGEIKTAIEYAEREEGRAATLWDLVQGFTASARELSFIDARVDLETRAGKLLDLVA